VVDYEEAMTDTELLALCIWREDRGDGVTGMTAVACVIVNRVRKSGKTYSQIIMAPFQFTSMSVASDPEYALLPKPGDPSYAQALTIASQAIAGVLEDITGGSTLYWAPVGIQSDKTITLGNGSVVPFPQHWNMAVVSDPVEIGKQIYLREV
jgi:hypothetical protein